MPQNRELREFDFAQLNLLLPIESLPAELPEDSKRELSLALASMLLRAAGWEVSNDAES